MTCLECGGSYKDKFGHLQLTDKYIGNFEVENVDYYKCDQCDDYLFPIATTKKIKKKKNEILNLLLNNQPIEAFMSVAETADYLDRSRQALHKHRRIRRGFIFQVEMGGKTWYLRKSVQLYKKKGDGRYPLVKHRDWSEYITMKDLQQATSLYYIVEQQTPQTMTQQDFLNKEYSERLTYD